VAVLQTMLEGSVCIECREVSKAASALLLREHELVQKGCKRQMLI